MNRARAILLMLSALGLQLAAKAQSLDYGVSYRLSSSQISGSSMLKAVEPVLGEGELSSQGYDVMVQLRYERTYGLDIEAVAWWKQVIYVVRFYDETELLIREDQDTLKLDHSGSGFNFSPVNLYRSVSRHAELEILSTSSLGNPPPDINLELVFSPQYERAGTLTAPELFVDGSDSIVSWSYVIGSEGFELEWVFIDSEHESLEVINSSNAFDWIRPVRLVSEEQHHFFNEALPAGTVYFRVRGLRDESQQGERGVLQGPWSNVASLVVSPGTMLTGINWQSVVSYAEHGRSKTLVTYYDGSLRNRQSVTSLSTDSLTLVSESVYDYESRPSISLIPTPMQGSQLSFRQGVHAFEGTEPENERLYDRYDGSAPLSTTSKVESYYGGQSGIEQLNADLLPQSEGYAYAQTVFTPDATGRVERQSMPGARLKINSDDAPLDSLHYTRFYYGKPSSTELHRLFGSNVGLSKHYTKEYAVDPDGQVSLTYKDQEDRVIATALTGEAPDNRLPLASYQPELSTFNLDSDNQINNLTGVSHSESKIVKTTPGDQRYYFYYDLEGVIPSGNSALPTLCRTCGYSLHIHIEDPDGKVVYDTLRVFPATPEDPNCGVDTAFTREHNFDTLFTKVGEYTVSKTLYLNEEEIFSTFREVRESAAVALDSAGLVESFLDQLNPSLCDVTCEQHCLTKVYRDNPTWDPQSSLWDSLDHSQQVDSLLLVCVEDTCYGVLDSIFAEVSEAECEGMEGAMLGQLYPDGYWNSEELHTADGHTPVYWAKLDGAVFLDSVGNVLSPSPPDASFYDWDKFVPSWAEELLPYHPEYCIHQKSCLQAVPAKDFARELMQVKSKSAAIFKNYDEINALLNADDFFSNSSALGWGKRGDMVDYMTSFVDEDEYDTDYNGDGYEDSTFTMWRFFELDYLYELSDPALPHNSATEWDMFRAAYLAYREELLQEIVEDEVASNSGCAFQSGEHALFPQPAFPKSESEIDSLYQLDTTGQCAEQCELNVQIWMQALFDNGCSDGDSSYFTTADSLTIASNLLSFCMDSCDASGFLSGALWLDDSLSSDLRIDSVITVLSGYPCGWSDIGTDRDFFCSGHTRELTFTTYQVIDAINDIAAARRDSSAIYSYSTYSGLDTVFSNHVYGNWDPYSIVWKSFLVPTSEIHNYDPLTTLCPGVDSISLVVYDKEDVTYPWWYTCSADASMSEYEYRLLFYFDSLEAKYYEINFVGSNPQCLAGSNHCIQIRFFTQDALGCHYIPRDSIVGVRNPRIDFGCEGRPPCQSGEGFHLHDSNWDWDNQSASCILTDVELSNGQIITTYVTTTGYGYWGQLDVKTDQLEVSLDTCIFNEENFSYHLDWQATRDSCISQQREDLLQEAEAAWQDTLRIWSSDYVEEHFRSCMNEPFDESFYYTTEAGDYHYTLYYYDQAGSLTQTVPPEGVDVLGSSAFNTKGEYQFSVEPNHRLKTIYRYNSLGQLTYQKTPDGGETRFWYDKAGQLRLSQNAKQATEDHFSYTKYDLQGRVEEVGLLDGLALDSTALSAYTPAVYALLDNYSFPEEPTYALSEQTITHYDDPFGGLIAQKYLRNRVSAVEVFDHTSTLVSTTAYSYNPHGHVDRVGVKVGDLPTKVTEYDFDLISGNVNEVRYQPGEADRFYHRYEYDADNRIEAVYTSRDGYIWDREARYFYYAHGPLARVEIGEYNVQALDYAYTLQGWIKAVNMPGALSEETDGFSRDEFGYALGYYEGDYTPAGAVNMGSASQANLWTGNPAGQVLGDGLFTGNIAFMNTDIRQYDSIPGVTGKGNKLMAYQYDQLNRLRQGTSFNDYTGSWSTLTGDQGDMAATYDGMGNILSLTRGNGDNFSYNYNRDGSSELVNNKLRGVGGLHGSNATSNYSYDEIGNLTADASDTMQVEWTVYGKVAKITTPGSTTEFTYDGAGERVSKTVTKPSGTVKTQYVRDAAGQLLSVYIDGVQEEVPLYGSSRLGVWNPMALRDTSHFTAQQGEKSYELSNHLGNVYVTLSDKKVGVDSTSDDTVDYYLADVLSVQDYYPYGSTVDGRNSFGDYRFGFNGMEREEEVNSDKSGYDFGARLYDSRVARWWSPDPLEAKYPAYSPYVFAVGKPTVFKDYDGRDIYFVINIKHYSEFSDKVIEHELRINISKISDPDVTLKKAEAELMGLGMSEGEAQQFFDNYSVIQDVRDLHVMNSSLGTSQNDANDLWNIVNSNLLDIDVNVARDVAGNPRTPSAAAGTVNWSRNYHTSVELSDGSGTYHFADAFTLIHEVGHLLEDYYNSLSSEQIQANAYLGTLHTLISQYRNEWRKLVPDLEDEGNPYNGEFYGNQEQIREYIAQRIAGLFASEQYESGLPKYSGYQIPFYYQYSGLQDIGNHNPRFSNHITDDGTDLRKESWLER